MLWVSSGFQTLGYNKTTRPADSWLQMFSRVWQPDETLALVFEIVLLASAILDVDTHVTMLQDEF